MRNYFPKRPSGAPLHTLSKLYDVPVGFVPPPLFMRLNIAFLRSPKGGCCSISDDLSCFSRDEVLMAPLMSSGVTAISTQRLIQGRAEVGYQGGGGSPLKTSFSERKATATNRMYINDVEACGMKCCYFWFNYNFFSRVYCTQMETVALWAF